MHAGVPCRNALYATSHSCLWTPACNRPKLVNHKKNMKIFFFFFLSLYFYITVFFD